MQIDQAQDDKALNRILDDPAHMAIINSSTWPVTKGISMLTKMELMQTLIIEEVITKRDVNIRAFRKGLFVLGFLNLCRDYADLTKPLFVHCEEEFTREKFMSLMAAVPPPDPATIPDAAKAFNFFEKYIKERESVTDGVGKHMPLTTSDLPC